MSQSMNQNEAIKQALSNHSRPKQASALSTCMTFSGRMLLKIKYVPEQLFDVTAFPVIYLLMFTYLFGGAIAGSTSAYLQFVLPGILVMTVVMITMYTGIELNNDIKKGVFDRFRTLPIWSPSVLIGALIVDVVRYSLASTIMLILGYALGFRADGGLLGILLGLATLLFFAFSISWIWTSLSLVMRSEKSLMAASMAILFPITFVSNVFVAPETMPSWLESFVNVNPISLLVDTVRGFMDGTPDYTALIWVVVVSVLLIAIFSPLTMYLYKKK
ncbi:ABC-2 type transport system permease protein [Pelagirhabdus alkalitolerans]|uniref:Transport permease protein n=1 Tax=Pelagirhabdus alkalitolerans TaxID=1612202 RepID=A0A1G6MJS5_9BACI|nr:ABC transporter permease [Pelagirhabdus alkalitolerans]SDC55721.1 ABC-2 type transport system permease protein [Pelagirhabdus alkalitolerans]